VSASRESFLFIVVINVLVSMCIFGVAFAMFAPESGDGGPAGPTGDEEVVALRQTVAELESELRQARMDRESLRSELGSITGRMGQLEESGVLAGGGPVFVSDGPPIKISREMKMMIGFASSMMSGRVKMERDRFLKDVMNPTEQSEKRKKRGIERAMRAIKRRVELTDAEAAEVTKILTELEDGRRATLKSLMETKEKPDDVEFAEVKRILEDSFVEEDRMIMQTLPPEKVVAYQETAEPFREMVYGLAKMAFPEPKEEKK
jgi:hypothetical protein